MSEPSHIRIEQVDTEPRRWMGWFETKGNPTWRSCRHRHHTEQAAWACVDARWRAVSREERRA